MRLTPTEVDFIEKMARLQLRYETILIDEKLRTTHSKQTNWNMTEPGHESSSQRLL
jgi:hypothetical protein